MGFDKRQLADRGGFEVIVYKEDDYYTRPDEFDCYDDTDKEAWHNGEWKFVTVVAEAFFEGVMVGDASLGGVENGEMPGAKSEDNPEGNVNAYGHTLGGEDCYDIPGDAVEEAKKFASRLYEAVQKRAIDVVG